MLNGSRDDQRGSIIVTIGVVMVIALLSAALLERNFSASRQTRRGQDFASALASADGGLAEALFKLDQYPDPLNMPSTIEGTGDFDVSGESYSYRGVKLDAETYRFQALGRVNQVPHAIQATVVRSLRYPYAIFANQGLDFNGNVTGTITSSPDTGLARIGSNGAINVSSGQLADFQDYYTPGGSCSGCSVPVQKDGPYATPDPLPPAGATQSCPSGGRFAGVIFGGDPYLCNVNVTIETMSVSPVGGRGVEIFIAANRSLTILNPGPPPAAALVNFGGDATNLIVNKAGTGALDMGSGSTIAKFSGVLYAPRSALVINGGQLDFNGSLVVNSLVLNGGPNLNFTWDSGLRPLVDRDWRIRYWQQVPSGSVSVP